MREYLVLRDYATPRLNGGGPATWVAGDVIDLGDDDAAWVGRDAPGTLDDGDLTDTEKEADKNAAEARQAKPAEQAKPARSRAGRRKDSSG